MKAFEFDRKIEAIARRQHGAISRAQVFAAGGSDRIVHRRLAEGSWSRPISGVYVLRWSSGTWLRQCKIAELSVPGSAVAGHSAAALHELDGFRRGHIELVSAPNSSQRHPFATVHRYAGALTTKVHGITVTSIAQTAFDLAISTRPWKLERAIDTAIQGRKLRVGELEERNHFYEGSRRPGLPRIRPLVLERTGEGWQPVESELEARSGCPAARSERASDPGAGTGSVVCGHARSCRLPPAGPAHRDRGRWPPLAHADRRLRPRSVAR